MEQTLRIKLTGMIETMPTERITLLGILDKLGGEGFLKSSPLLSSQFHHLLKTLFNF